MATDPFLVLLHSTISVLTKSFKLPFRLEIKFVMKTAWSFPFINVLMRLNIPIYSLKRTFNQLLPQLVDKATRPQIFKIPSICIKSNGTRIVTFVSYGKHDESDLNLHGFYKPGTLFLLHAGRLAVIPNLKSPF